MFRRPRKINNKIMDEMNIYPAGKVLGLSLVNTVRTAKVASPGKQRFRFFCV